MAKYALLFGANVFQNPEIPPIQAKEDIEFWKNILIDKHQYQYNHIQSFFETDFTTQKVLVELIKYANLLIAGDVLTLFISSHGSTKEKKVNNQKHIKNFIETYDGYFTENMLFGLFKLFKPGVTVGVITDCCYTGDMFNDQNKKIDEHEIRNVIQAVHLLPKEIAREIVAAYNAAEDLPLSCSIWHLASSYSGTVARDGFFRKINQIYYDCNFDSNQLHTLQEYASEISSIIAVVIKQLYLEQLNLLLQYDLKDIVSEKINAAYKLDLKEVENREALLEYANEKDKSVKHTVRMIIVFSLKKIMSDNVYGDDVTEKIELIHDKLHFYNQLIRDKYPPLYFMGVPNTSIENIYPFS